MKVLYLECNMGVAGDMLMSALWELVNDKEAAKKYIDNIGLPNTTIEFENKISSGVSGTHARVLCDGVEEGEHEHSHDLHHHHSMLSDVKAIIISLNINDRVKELAFSVYDTIAAAEAVAHNTTIDNIHFHEVGTLDAIADTVVCSYLFDLINPDKVICSPINVGSGNVKCQHGILPVPAPATALILSDVPFYKSEIKTELCTPTGAALVRTFVDSFGKMPAMVNTKLGYGMGTKELPLLNCVRAYLGDSFENTIELACNLDDMTPEALAYACDVLMKAGARDVYQTPITMKKSRLGIMLSVICNEADKNKMLELIFKHTTTIGVREYALNRETLDRKIKIINTRFGKIASKESSGFGVEKTKLEFDDLKRIADSNNLSIDDVKKLIKE